MRSKLEIFNLFKYGLKMYLPEYRNCNIEFLRQILFGSKSLLTKKQILMVDVPRWDEFHVRKFYDNIKHLPKFQAYLPDIKEYLTIYNHKYNIVNKCSIESGSLMFQNPQMKDT